MYKDYDYLFKTSLIGDLGAGKTSLKIRISDMDYYASNYMTIGVDFAIRKFDVFNNTVKLQIWDTVIIKLLMKS